MKQLFTLLLISFCSLSCKKDFSTEYGIDPAFGFINLEFQATFKEEPLVLGKTYLNQVSEPFEVNRFKFYVHSVRLLSVSNKMEEVFPREHFLIDFEKPNAASAKGYVYTGRYNALEFTIGVDSTRNFSGMQTGALDPLNGMFWAWSSGHVYAKLE